MENSQSFNIPDLIFITVLSISILLGLIRGVIREVLSLVGLAASVYLAFTFSESLSVAYVEKFLENSRWSYLVTFVSVIVVTLFAVTLVNLFFSSLLKASGLSFLNRVFGALFGTIRGIAICSIIVMVIGIPPEIRDNTWWKESTMIPFFQKITKKTIKHIPENVINYVESTKDKVGKEVGDLIPAVPEPADDQGLPVLESITDDGAVARPAATNPQ